MASLSPQRCKYCGHELWGLERHCLECGRPVKSSYPVKSAREVEVLFERLISPYELAETPQELHEVEVVRPETIARWRAWHIPEEIIERAIQQRLHAYRLRKVEGTISIPDFAYRMPRCPEVEAEPKVMAMAIDTDGTIYIREPAKRDKIAKIDRWLYRYEYERPIVVFDQALENYELAERVANMMYTGIYLTRERVNGWRIRCRALAWTGRAVRICTS
ncbi:MAG: hypothetical protein AOA65_0082 [Candidatus Bathyarchaeota archaeon BA1]|nr:MAG: hypothetical protein AOA65_0082 [Candidatus Bathyarchaeota archaeon BA1]